MVICEFWESEDVAEVAVVTEDVGRWDWWRREAGESTPGGGIEDIDADDGLVSVFKLRVGAVAPRTFAWTASIAWIFAVAAAALNQNVMLQEFL